MHPAQPPNHPHQPHYNSIKKYNARYETIISQYRELFSNYLPKSKQYWSICALNAGADNSILPGSELHQALLQHLISPSQFYGVDIVPEIIGSNQSALPLSNWYCGDFYETMVEFSYINHFNPGIINCDYLKSPKYGAPYVAKILSFLTDSKINDTLLVCNLILKGYLFNFSETELVEYLIKQPNIKNALRHGWKIKNKIYTYWGNFGERTKMGSIIFYKK